jgi:hypothetical protein
MVGALATHPKDTTDVKRGELWARLRLSHAEARRARKNITTKSSKDTEKGVDLMVGALVSAPYKIPDMKYNLKEEL